MNEGSAEQAKGREDVEQLQMQFGNAIDKWHTLAGQAFPDGNRFLAPGRHNLEAATSLANELLMGFDNLYRRVPEGYHLDVGLSPLVWHEIAKNTTINLLLRKEMTPTGPEYYLNVGRFVDNPSKIEPNRRVLNLTPTGSTDPNGPPAKLEGMMVSKNGYDKLSVLFYPEDITAIKIVANPQTK